MNELEVSTKSRKLLFFPTLNFSMNKNIYQLWNYRLDHIFYIMKSQPTREQIKVKMWKDREIPVELEKKYKGDIF